MAVKGFLGKGFRFPVQTDKMTGRMMASQYEEDIREAIYIILMTRKGERIMRPDFGCGIHQYTFTAFDYTTEKAMKNEIQSALSMWEPRIIQIQIAIEQDKMESQKLIISISYVVRTTNNPYNLVYPFYIQEGFGN